MISLSLFTVNDFDRLIAWVQSPEDAMQFAGPSLQYPITHQQLTAYIAAPNRIIYKVANQEKIIGHCAITNKDETTAVLNHILIGEVEARNLGFGKQIVQAMLQIIFDNMQKNIAELYVFDWNINAIKCYEKIGFIIDENNVRHREVNGKQWCAINMVLYAKDYHSNNQKL